MTPTQLSAIIACGEDSRHQFKRDFTNAESMAAELAAFANMGGGLNKPYVDTHGRIWVKTGADKRQVTAREEMQRMFQQAGLLHADEQAVSAANLENIEGTLAEQYERSLAFIKRNLHHVQGNRSFNSPGQLEIPTEAFEEILVNALASHAFHILPYQGMGSGIPRALEDWPQIEFTDDRQGNQFRVTLKRPDVQQPESGGVNGGVNEVVNDKMSVKMSGKMSGKIVAALLGNPNLTIPELADAVGVTTRTIERTLTKLQHEGSVVRIGPAKGGHWKVLN